VPQNCSVTHIPKFIQVWNNLRVSKWWQNFHFWVNYPFKLFSITWKSHEGVLKQVVNKLMFTRQWYILKTERFFFLFRFLRTDKNIVKTIPVHMDPRKQIKTLYYACQASLSLCKEVLHICHICTPIDWTLNMHAHDVTIFTNSRFCSLHGDDNAIIFKNLHFETRFHTFVFSGTENSVLG